MASAKRDWHIAGETQSAERVDSFSRSATTEHGSENDQAAHQYGEEGRPRRRLPRWSRECVVDPVLAGAITGFLSSCRAMSSAISVACCESSVKNGMQWQLP
jgi:hypothetical protein